MLKTSATMHSLLLCFLSLPLLQAQPPGPPTGRVSLSPQTHEINLDERPRTHVYRISNLGQNPVELAVEVLNWEQDAEGRMVMVEPTETSLDQWFIINPTTLSIPPGETRAVRFAIRPAVELPRGEHRAAVIFQQIGDPPAPEGRGGITFTARFRLQSAVYATVGDVERKGNIDAVLLLPNVFLTTISCNTNAHVRPRGRLQVWQADAFPGITPALQAANADTPPDGLLFSSSLNERPVLPGNTRTIAHPLDGEPLTPGSYKVLVNGFLGDESIQKVWDFEITEPTP